jgi:small subunit ribosomal protein S4e
MARGPKKHLKRLNAPSHWMLSKMGGIWAPRPSTGPHRLRECLPICLILRNRLKYALTRREVLLISARKFVKVDGKVRTDQNYPAGFQDVVTIDKTSENFRLLYDTKGRFVLHRISPDEAQYKLCRVKIASRAKKASIGRNPLATKQAAAIPFIVTHDGRTVRYPDPLIRVNDTVKVDLATGKALGYIKFDLGNVCMVTGGKNTGRIGVLTRRERHPGSWDIVHIKDRRGHEFSTRSTNVFVIGQGNSPWVSLPHGKGIKLTVEEEKAAHLSKKKE